MTVNFKKYQGTGNDFIMIDNRVYGLSKKQTDLYKHLCDRKFGIGADGLILLNEKNAYDFEMVYFNSDGNESTMCGNGGRCLIKFAHHLAVIGTQCRFWAIDGGHEGSILPDGRVSLKMKDVDAVETTGQVSVLNTGSPHYVTFVQHVKNMDVYTQGHNIRYSQRFAHEGINVNFVEQLTDNRIFVRTYERGVEDETLSCGTGVVASGIAFALQHGNMVDNIAVETLGGQLAVSFKHTDNTYHHIYLTGPAERVFEGSVEI